MTAIDTLPVITIGDVKAERGMRVSALQRVQAESNPHEARLVGAQELVSKLEGTLADVDDRIKLRMKELAIYDYWQHGFSKQGLQSLLVEEVATRFNAMRGEVIPVLTQGVYDVQFSTISRTKAGEARERTEFVVTEHGKPVPYEALSGGQRRRIDVGVMLTMVLAVSEWMQVPGVLGLLVLDEVFGFLDAAGAEGLMEVLAAIESRIPAVYVVTHDAQLQALFPRTIIVEQDEHGVSRLVAPQEEKHARRDATRTARQRVHVGRKA